MLPRVPRSKRRRPAERIACSQWGQRNCGPGQKGMLKQGAITGYEGVLRLAHDIAIQAGESGRQLPEQLLEPEIANKNTDESKTGYAAFTQCYRRVADRALLIRNICQVFLVAC